MSRLLVAPLILLINASALAQGPEITSWKLNTNGAVGYNNILSNVQKVQYSTANVYVSCTCIPGYSIGPWSGNPNTPVNQNFIFKITRQPVKATGTPRAVGLGHIGVWSNGVTIYNPKDAASYNNAGVWHQNAYFFEGASFDDCLGHPAPNGEYHHHINPTCLYNDKDSTHHAPIIGYAFDGFPVYGAYGYTNADGSGPIKRMTSSYLITTTTSRAGGPPVNSTLPAGAYCEDYTYTQGAGTLDEHNGRFCVTPEYPSGIYAYFVTIDAALQPVYPFVIGDSYYGSVQAGNTGPGSGHNTISETVVAYTGTTGIGAAPGAISFQLSPNPVKDWAYLYLKPSSPSNMSAILRDARGQTMVSWPLMQPSMSYAIDCSSYPAGLYFLTVKSGEAEATQRVLVVH